MVRVVSQNFSPPRSRHSSGDTDRDLAERTNLALSSLGRKKCDLPEYESSSDSFWDSELDGEHGYDTVVSESGENSNDINGNAKSDVQSKRRERRRERNKLSAQAYRMRRRNQNVKEQQELMHLEAENKRLHKLVEALEKKKEDARQRLRDFSGSEPLGAVGGILPPQPSTHKEISHTSGNKNDAGPSFIAPDYINHHPPLNPSPAFHRAMPHPSQISFREPDNPEPVFVKDITSAQNSLSLNQKSPCPASPSARLLINANGFKGALFVSEGTQPTVCIPAILAIPVAAKEQSFNANLNCKPVKANFPKPALIEPSCRAPDDLCSGTPQSEATGDHWWKVNGNQLCGTEDPIPNAAYSVKMERCNTNNLNNTHFKSNANDPNGNCDKRSYMQQFAANSPQSFNMNHVEASDQASQDQTAQLKMRHPKKQYYDQFRPVPVQ